MNNKEIKIVIGANFGDEGKGLMTDYYAKNAARDNKKSIVVLSNGGPQRGHTVKLLEGNRHVFHHFGSGTYRNSATYFPKEFIMNPMVFMEEYQVLAEEGYTPLAFANPMCMVTTPYDMMLNQIIEEHRAGKRHGSCGFGIWETLLRDGLKYKEMYELGRDGMKAYLTEIRDNYMPGRLKAAGVNGIPEHWKTAVYADWIIDRYVDDFYDMYELTGGFKEDIILYNYDIIIFENGQGLLLDWDMETIFGDNVTASYTGLKNPKRVITEVFGQEKMDIEVCYVTRTYMTRHGAGRFDTECAKEEINPDMVDATNVPNPHQGTIRYGKLNVGELLARCEADFAKYPIGEAVMRLAVTHLNEYPMAAEDMKHFKYKSDTAKG